MKVPRIIPILLLNNGGLYKGENFTNYRYVGDPINAVKIFNSKCVDELIFLDISVTKTNEQPKLDLIEKIADECYMPFSVGGGIKSVDSIKAILSAGAEKVCINTALYENIPLLSEASEYFGSQSIVASIDVRKNWLGQYVCYSNSGTVKRSHDLASFCVEIENQGCGEILLTNIDHEGKMIGFDVQLYNSVGKDIKIPLIANGGAGNLDHFKTVIQDTPASAAAAGSFFTFHGRKKAVLITYPDEKEIRDLFNNAM